MAKNGRFQSSPPKKKGLRIFLITLLVPLLILGSCLAGGTIYYNSMLNLITRPTPTEREVTDQDLEAILGYVPEKQEAAAQIEETLPPLPSAAADRGNNDNILNIMLIGQNFRKGEEHKLSDTLILCSINKETNTVTLTSFLRDMYVKLPDYQDRRCGWNRINVAYNLGWFWNGELGGMEMLDMLMLETFGVEVDYNIEIGFETFKQIIDIMGGVDIELTAAEAAGINSSQNVSGTYHSGMNLLKGDAALCYVRTRNSTAGDNDFNRTARQRKLMISMLNKCKTLSAGELNTLLQEVLPLIITDMSNAEITACAVNLLPMLKDLTVETQQIPAEGTYQLTMVKLGSQDASVIKFDLESNRAIVMEIAEGILPEPKE